MKKVKSPVIVLVVILLILVTFSSFVVFEVKADTQILFHDDFENYDVDTFPSGGGWQLWYNGMGNEHQVIVDTVANSPTKSLQLFGRDYGFASYWGAYAAQPINTEMPMIGFNVSVKVSGIGNGTRVIAQVGFGDKIPPSTATTYAPVYFLHNGNMELSNLGIVQTYIPEKWYKVTVIVNRNTETYSCWIDDKLQGENIVVPTNRGLLESGETTWNVEALSLSQDFHSVKVYFDDVTVFSYFDADPRLELEPISGVAATTLVGSGFAPNSRISVSWDGIPLHTVPDPLVSDLYGSFTAIISVLNQTLPRSYVVRAVDEYGYSADATFEVVSVVPPVSEEPNQTTVAQNSETTAASLAISGFQSFDSLLFIVPAVFALAAFYTYKKRSSKFRECKT